MNDVPQDFDDDLSPWLSAAREDAVAPNAQRLDAIGRAARAAFVDGSASAGSNVDADPAGSSDVAASDGTLGRSNASPAKADDSVAPSTSSPRTGSMTWIVRTLALAAALAGVAAFGIWSIQPRPAQGFPLGEALDPLLKAETLHLAFREKQGEGTLWVETPGRLRMQYTPQRYDIVQGSRLWRVNEADPSVEEESSPYFDRATQELDLFALLGLADVDPQSVKSLEPTDVVEYDGVESYRYRLRVPTPEADLEMVAYADVESKQLKSLLFYPFRPDGKLTGVPVREFHLVALNQAPPAGAFQAKTDLRGDGGLAKVVETYGVVTLRPIDQRRWTPICREARLFQGDWLRTELRGAHAATVRMDGGARVTLGPGALVEFLDANRIRVYDGDVAIEATEKLEAPFVALGPKEGSFEIQEAGSIFLQVRARDTLVRLEASPKWLVGLETTSAGNSLGSLLVEVEGRNVPLTIGEHRVKAVIRDQIARTTIEETFVNETKERLEGVFTFPLPADASISGFAMWVGDEKVQADIVEKQRARQIYETILHEKRDPGLLEWTAGNVFQARVFPIEPNSSKRIEIQYTQVLPMRGGAYRYRYNLMSDLLRRHPLDELLIHVDAQSAIPLARVHSPTHPIRLEENANTAIAEFTAKEYVPESDFEMVFETSGMRPEVVFLPHQRGDDGYFLLQLSPPSEGAWKREVLRDGPPLKILLLCDTSASIDDGQRARQKELVQATLAALGPDDKFLLATTDVDTLVDGDWQASSDAAREKALARLDSRLSFGWTDLAKAVETIAPHCDESTQVLYLGDGIVTVGDATPEPALEAIGRIAKERALGTFHAMALGSTYEARLLKALAAIGGGTYRTLNTDDQSAAVVQEWLAQIASPGLTDVKVTFEGIRTAAVYPAELPRLPEGMQQVVVGRYLPDGKPLSGQAIVTGKLNGEAVKYVAKISPPPAISPGAPRADDASDDLSFIPRLWAKARIDWLLSQSVDNQAKDEIIVLSEQFRLMTPYTSLLVLESDADRERFGVKRQIGMTDGERFFASAEEKAALEQRRKLLAQTKRYRQGLRMQAAAAIAQMGRDEIPWHQQNAYTYAGIGIVPMSGPVSSTSNMRFRGLITLDDTVNMFGTQSRGENLYFDSSEFATAGDYLMDESFATNGRLLKDMAGAKEQYEWAGLDGGELFSDSDFDGQMSVDRPSSAFDGLAAYDSEAKFGDFEGEELAKRKFDAVKAERWDMDLDSVYEPYGQSPSRYARLAGRMSYNSPRGGAMGGGGFGGRAISDFSLMAAMPAGRPMLGFSEYESNGPYYYPTAEAFPDIFPALSGAPPAPAANEPLPESWTPEAIRIADRLVQRDKLAGDARLSIRSETVSRYARWDHVSMLGSSRTLLARDRWLVETASPGSFTEVDWVADGQRRAAYPYRGTGRYRDAAKTESLPSFDAIAHGAERPLYRSHAEYQVRVASDDGQTATLEMVWSVWKSLITVDLARNVVTRIETFRTDLKDEQGQPKKSGETRFEEIAQAGGLAVVGKKTVFDEEGRVESETKTAVETLTVEAYDPVFAEAHAFENRILWLHVDLPSFLVANAAVDGGKFRFEDAWVVFTTEVGRQGWDAAEKALAQVRDAVEGERFALEEVQFHFDRLARRGEKALAIAKAKLAGLAARGDEGSPDEYVLAEIYRDFVLHGVTAQEWMEILETLRPLYERQRMPEYGLLVWLQYQVWALDSLNRTEAATEAMRDRVSRMLWSYSEQVQYARRIKNEGKNAAAKEYLLALLTKPYDASERDQIRSYYSQFLEEDREYAELLKFLEEWTAGNVESYDSYSRLLWTLLAVNREADAEKLVAAWLARAEDEKPLTGKERAQAAAAVRYRVGYVHNISRHALSVEQARKNLEFARRMLAFPDRWEFVTTFFDYSAFSNMEQGYALRADILETLRRRYRELTHDQLETLRRFVYQDGSEKVIAFNRELAAYWEEEREKQGALSLILTERLWELYASTPFTWQDRIDYCREIISESDRHRDLFQERLVDLLLDPPADQLDETLPAALREIPKLGQSLPPLQRKIAQLTKLQAAATVIPERLAVPERTELERLVEAEPQNRKEHNEKLEAVRDRSIEKTMQLFADFQPQAPEFLRPWIQMTLWKLAAKLDREADRAAIVAGLREIVGDKPSDDLFGEKEAEPNDGAAPTAEEIERDSDEVLKQELVVRSIAMLAWYASRKEASPELVDFVRGWLETAAAADERGFAWRHFLYQFLLVKNDGDRAEKYLRQWSAAGAAPGRDENDPSVADLRALSVPWRRELAMLVAERGDLDEAIRLFEALKADRVLAPGDLLLLADWRLAQGDEPGWKALRREAWELAEEYTLYQILQQTAQQWSYGESKPERVDEETLRQFEILFQKSTTPENYVWVLRDIYNGSKDFRLLASIPRQVVGRTAGKAFPFAQSVAESVLAGVHEEATLNGMRVAIEALRKERTGDDAQSVTDRRLLDLSLALVELRASNVKNQPGPHIQAALAALKSARQESYRKDEAVPAASFLRSAISYFNVAPETTNEILSQMEALERVVDQTSEDRLRIAALRMQALNSVSRLADALLVGQAAFDDFRAAKPDEFPSALMEVLATRMSLLESQARYRESERLLESVEALARKKAGDDWYDGRLVSLWKDALYHGQQVSVGQGKALYEALRDKQISRIEAALPRDRADRMNFLADIFTTARDRNIAGVAEDVDRFIVNRFDELVADLPEQFAGLVSRFGSVLETVFSAKRRLAFLLDRLEDYPPLLAWEADHRNRNFGDEIAHLRLRIEQTEGEKLGELEEPTLRFMIQELQRELRWRQSTQRSGWSRNYESTTGLFWVAKKDRFRDAALAVLAETPDSVDALLYVSGFLHNDLGMTKDAAVVLKRAWERGIDQTPIGYQLVSYLRTDGREAEAIPYLVILVEREPSNVQYRSELIYAYFHDGTTVKAHRAFDEAKAYLEKHDLRTESNLAELGDTGIDVGKVAEGVAMIEDAIRMREQNVPPAGSGDSTFSVYYADLAEGYLKLGEGRKAFDAASSAVVLWGSNRGERADAIVRFRDILRRMPEREKFLADWDAEVAESGKDSQLLRKELGRVLLEEGAGSAKAAVVQLDLAAELGGIDPELDQLRTDAHALAGDADGLRQAWLDRVRHTPREYGLYAQFARTIEQGDPLIERVITTGVELDPTEGGSHQALAEWRVEHGDLDAALGQWRRVQALRTFDPAGWLGEGRILVRQERWDVLKGVIKKLRETSWTNPPGDLSQQIDVIANEIPADAR